MVRRVKVNNKHQIAVPAAVRKELHIESGDHLLMEVRNGYIVLMPEPRAYSQHLRGLHREIWEGIEPQEYVQREREDWATEHLRDPSVL
jgi:AbrB family looped-hinge helix DNA binding protein